VFHLVAKLFSASILTSLGFFIIGSEKTGADVGSVLFVGAVYSAPFWFHPRNIALGEKWKLEIK
jgi:hypothetical protein